MNDYKVIDVNTWARKNTFNFFLPFANPCFNVTSEVNVESVYKYAKEHKYSFFLMTLYALHQASDTVPEFRQRMVKTSRGGWKSLKSWSLKETL